MANIKGKVGSFDVEFLSIPKGPSGTVQVKVANQQMELSWKRDAQGMWVRFNGEAVPQVAGYDFTARVNDDGLWTYEMRKRNSAHYLKQLRFVKQGEEIHGSQISTKKKNIKIKAQMPGRIVKVLVKEGDDVQKDSPLLIMEAMKMENQIKAPSAGKVTHVKVIEGQNVEMGVELVLIGT